MLLLLRCLVVNSTSPPRSADDQPVARRKYRIVGDGWSLGYIAASVPGGIAGGIAGGKYRKALHNEGAARYATQLRIVSPCAALALHVCLIVATLLARFKIRYIDKRACHYLLALAPILVSSFLADIHAPRVPFDFRCSS